MEKGKRVNWMELETHYLLTIIRDQNIVEMLDEKRFRNAKIFKNIEEELKKRSFLKTGAQIRAKWKALKQNYFKAKRANAISGSERVECPFWEELDQILSHRLVCKVEGVDASCSSQYESEGGTTSELLMSDDVPETQPQPVASTSMQPQEEAEREPGPVRKKRKVVKKSYGEALNSFSRDLKESQQEMIELLLNKQAEIVAKELETQRQWEQRLLEEDRKATEKMLTNMMSTFFQNIQNISSFNGQFTFCNPSDHPLYNPFPSPPDLCFPRSPGSPSDSELSQPKAEEQ